MLFSEDNRKGELFLDCELISFAVVFGASCHDDVTEIKDENVSLQMGKDKDRDSF
jgi:hypothetical protein